MKVLHAFSGLGCAEVGTNGKVGSGGKKDLARALALLVFVDASLVSLSVGIVFQGGILMLE